MTSFSTGRKPINAFSLASLTDIVLLLLIFFLITSSFVTQYGLRVNLPDVSAAAPLDQETIAVTIESNGQISVDDAPVAADSLAFALAAVRGERTVVAIYADREAQIGSLAAVAAASAALNLRVSIATDAQTALPMPDVLPADGAPPAPTTGPAPSAAP